MLWPVRHVWTIICHDHVWQIFGTNVESWPTPMAMLATFHTSLRYFNHIPRYSYVLQFWRLSALIWPRKTVWWHSCERAFQHDYFICNTEQPGFIPTMPTVNNKTEMDKLNITENIILSILKELNISKAPGPYEISTRLLMELSDEICHPLWLCKISVTSVKTCCIPDDSNLQKWK